jgi:hypothetical protein
MFQDRDRFGPFALLIQVERKCIGVLELLRPEVRRLPAPDHGLTDAILRANFQLLPVAVKRLLDAYGKSVPDSTG